MNEAFHYVLFLTKTVLISISFSLKKKDEAYAELEDEFRMGLQLEANRFKEVFSNYPLMVSPQKIIQIMFSLIAARSI